MTMPRVDGIELCRTEIGRIADALEVLIEQYGTRENAARKTRISRELFSRFAKRGAYEIVFPEGLAAIAQAHGISVDELRAGKGPKPKLRARP
jgi:hypothetical protein